MANMRQLLTYKLTSPRLDAKMAQAFCWTCSIIVMVAGIRKLSRLELTEKELIFGITLVMAVTVLGIVAGLLMPIVDYVARR